MEIHNADELEVVNDFVDIIGVNNRNLKTFEVSVEISVELSKQIPDKFVKTSITEKVDAAQLKKAIESGEVTLSSDIAEIVTGESSLIIK